MSDVKQIGPLGVMRSATSPRGGVALLFGYDYQNSGKPVQAAHLNRQQVRDLAKHLAEVNADLDAEEKAKPGKELVRKPEPEAAKPAARVRVRRRT